jgi:hypothetical protein
VAHTSSTGHAMALNPSHLHFRKPLILLSYIDFRKGSQRANYHAMIGLIFFAVVSVGFLAAFLLLGVKGRPKPSPKVCAVAAVGRMIRLVGVSFGNCNRLLDDSDYRRFLQEPRLREVAKKLRATRQALVLQWIAALMGDLRSLWRFRRLLVRHGAQVRFTEEFKILQTFACCCALLFALKLSVHVAGPFAAARLVRQAGGFVGKLSDLTAATLARVPCAAWPEIERSWAAQAA